MAPTAELDLIDLDDAAPLDRKVKLGGKTYRVPGDAPVGWLLQFRQVERAFIEDAGTDDGANELDYVERVCDLLVELFTIRQPDREDEIRDALEQKGSLPLLQTVGRLYGNPARELAEEAEQERPTRPAGTTSGSPRRPRSRSRSSASSAS